MGLRLRLLKCRPGTFSSRLLPPDFSQPDVLTAWTWSWAKRLQDIQRRSRIDLDHARQSPPVSGPWPR
jgi:hypothetical protein